MKKAALEPQDAILKSNMKALDEIDRKVMTDLDYAMDRMINVLLSLRSP